MWLRLEHSAAKHKLVLLHKISHSGEGKAQCISDTGISQGIYAKQMGYWKCWKHMAVQKGVIASCHWADFNSSDTGITFSGTDNCFSASCFKVDSSSGDAGTQQALLWQVPLPFLGQTTIKFSMMATIYWN